MGAKEKDRFAFLIFQGIISARLPLQGVKIRDLEGEETLCDVNDPSDIRNLINSIIVGEKVLVDKTGKVMFLEDLERGQKAWDDDMGFLLFGGKNE